MTPTVSQLTIDNTDEAAYLENKYMNMRFPHIANTKNPLQATRRMLTKQGYRLGSTRLVTLNKTHMVYTVDLYPLKH